MKTVFENAHIGTLELKNRLIMPPMGTELADQEGQVTKRLLDYYARRAQGGVSLVIVEISAVDRKGIGILSEISIWDDRFLPGLRSLASTIKEGGAHAAIQVHHAGRQTSPQVIGTQPVAPSPIPCPLMKHMPRELSTTEVQDLVEKFAQGARRAKDAGFDAVEFHGTHGYLIAQFLSPSANKRTDEYGGDNEGRARFAVEIVRRARQLVGPDYPLIFRISASEFTPDGVTLEDAKLNAQLLEQAGVDAIHISGGTYARWERISPPILIPRGHLVEYGAEIKKVINVPLIIVGNINRVSMAESILRADKADFVAFGRALIADPELPNKSREGRTNEIIRCITCNTCMDQIALDQGIACLQNPEVGQEGVLEEPAASPKRVVVRGDGPAALEAARVARLRGHDVQLVTGAPRFGGRWSWMIDPFVHDKVKVLRELGVQIRLGQDLTPELLSEVRPDAVMYLADSDPLPLGIPGGGQDNVISAEQLLAGQRQPDPGQTAVILGGGNVGCEAADFLRRRDVGCVIVEHGVRAGDGIEPIGRKVVLQRAAEHGTEILSGARAVRIDGSQLTIVNKEGQESTRQADFVVTALGYAQRDVPAWLPATVADLHRLPDCQKPRRVIDALREGAAIARKL